MKKNQDQSENIAELRRRAEERSKRRRSEGGGQRTELETERLVHELQVHQIELEMQNEELQQARAQLETLLAQYTDLYNFAPTGYMTLDREGSIRQVNMAAARLLGVARSRLSNRRFGLFVAEGDRRAFSDFLEKIFASQAQECCEVELPQEGHHPLFVRIEGTRSADGQECRAVVLDITAHRQAEEQTRAAQAETQELLALSEQSRRALLNAAEDEKLVKVELIHERGLLYALMDNLPDCVYFKDAASRFVKINQAHAAFMGLKDPVDAIGKADADFKPRAFAEQTLAEEQKIVQTGQPLIAKVDQNAMANGSIQWTSVSKAPIKDKNGRVTGLVGISRDITEEIHLQQQLHQAQKMETVGRLAGGVAHDFNNLLQVINGNAELSIKKLEPENPLRKNLEFILESGKRAASLTCQLLAFSRKQALQPVILDINKTIAGMEKMLRRLIGEDIDFVTVYASDLAKIKGDAARIEQVLMNLAVNSRDAMPNGGKLTIETANVDLDDEYAARHFGVTPGAYVMMAVTDSGCGMDEKTQESIFEPFFTTKDAGKGTGLGLAMVYGIVKQSGGYIWVYSEPGMGTTFKVYLPRDTSIAETPLLRRPETKSRVGNETILLVEDDVNIRILGEEILTSAGYAVLACANPGEALLTREQHPGAIHLLLTDVVMPQMYGRQLADKLLALCPEMKVLYMSGYTDDAIVRHGVLNQGTLFISKPFTVDELTRKVREALDQ